jgi:phosphomethylpyrimidine synthase
MEPRTFIEKTQEGTFSKELIMVAESEKLSVEEIAAGVVQGTVVIPANPAHLSLTPRGIGKGLRTKVNANLGTSQGNSGLEYELAKLKIAVEAGADAVMDLSTGGDVQSLRQQLLHNCPVPFGTVPIYEAALLAREKHGSILEMSVEDIFGAIEGQAVGGVDFMTIHTGITLGAIKLLQEQGRVADVVSRGGSFLLAWMLHHEQENPLYVHFDRLLEIARRYEVTLSLGDALRPGAIADATDRAQIHELITLGQQVQCCRKAGVQVMVEGPGHVPINQIAANVVLQKQLCQGAPFYVLGPLVTDVAPGYDHITSAIGGALAAMAGADFLCYVTPAEHLGLPDAQQVREGVIASRIAAHAADLAKGVPGAAEWDLQMSRARKALDWETQERLALDPEPVRAYRSRNLESGECTMCGPFCAMKIVSNALGGKKQC